VATCVDRKTFSEWIAEGASVLDLGCGDGALLSYLTKQRHIHGQGIELDAQAITHCVAEGLSVYQQDIDTGLSEYSDGNFDYVILNQTLQQVKKPDYALKEALTVEKRRKRHYQQLFFALFHQNSYRFLWIITSV